MSPVGNLAVTASAAATILFALLFAPTIANEEVEALMAFRHVIQDPDGMLNNWDENLVDPCTWIRIDCNDNNRVTRIDFESINISGHLVPELGKLAMLQYMELRGNNLEGPIPPEFGNLTNLIAMDLYNNNLSGPLPSTLANLKNLVFLRVNDNRLTGPIPAELAELPQLSMVDFSNNDFCGPIPPFQNTPPEKFSNNPRLNSNC